MKGTPIFAVILGIIAVIVLLCTHTVKEWEQALILEFGQAKRVENTRPKPGSNLNCLTKRSSRWIVVILRLI